MTPSLSRITVALASLFILHGVHANEPVATVNDTPIPATRAEVMLDEQFAQGMEDSPQLREAVREELIRREILTQAAREAGTDQQADVQEQMELARQAILIRAYLQDYMAKNPVTAADVEREYQRMKDRMGEAEYRTSHILVETDTEAKAVIAALRAGEDFAELADERSIDPGSSDKGGDLGWSRPGMFVESFASAMTELEKGEFNQTPIESEYGWHVIRLDDIRESPAPELELVESELRQRMEQRKVEAHLDALRADARID